jgi:Lar family restriction alleviation protein
MAKLKPCPECGSKFVGLHEHFFKKYKRVICVSCRYLGPEFFDEKTAIKMWNNRERKEETK